jgi:hypothetical protein
MELILPVLISIQKPIHHCARFAFPSDCFVGILSIAAMGTRLNAITLISASQNSQNCLKFSHGLKISSIRI